MNDKELKPVKYKSELLIECPHCGKSVHSIHALKCMACGKNLYTEKEELRTV